MRQPEVKRRAPYAWGYLQPDSGGVGQWLSPCFPEGREQVTLVSTPGTTSGWSPWCGLWEGVPQCTPSADVKLALAVGRRAAGGRHAATAGRCAHSSARTTEWASGAERWLSDPLAPAQTAQDPLGPPVCNAALPLVAVANTSLCARSGEVTHHAAY